MAQDTELEALKARVRAEGFGPLNDVLNATLEAGASLLTQLRRSAIDHPFTAVYVALQVGYFVGKLARRYAQR